MSVRSLQLVWDEHLPCIGKLFEKLYEDELLVDVTISCRDGNIRAHKIILSVSSPYFHNVFKDNPCKHPTLIMRGVSYHDMRKLIEYMYRGTIDVSVEQVNSIIQLALDLDVKGFEKYKSANFNASSQAQNNNFTQDHEEIPKVTHNIDTRFKGQKRVIVNHVDDNVQHNSSRVSNVIGNNSNIIITDVRGGVIQEANTNIPNISNLNSEPGSVNNENQSNIDLNTNPLSIIPLKNDDFMKRNNKDVPECEICLRKYKSRKDLHRHMKAHTKQFSFSRASHLVRHRRVHTGERPFICDVCGKDFARQDKLKLHKRTNHTEEKLYTEFQGNEYEQTVPGVLEATSSTTTSTNMKMDTFTSFQNKVYLEDDEPENLTRIEDNVLKNDFDPLGDTASQIKRGRGRPRKYPLQIPVIVLPKRGRGRPRKQQDGDDPIVENTDNVEGAKKDYDFSSLPYGDLNYLTMPLDDGIPMEPLIEISTDLPNASASPISSPSQLIKHEIMTLCKEQRISDESNVEEIVVNSLVEDNQ